MFSHRFVFACLAAVSTAVFPTTTRALSIQSGSQWLATATNPGGLDWTQTGFDDSGWISAFAPYPNPTSANSFIPGTTAQFMW